MICHDCGYEIADNLKYCNVCGTMQRNVAHLYNMVEPDADKEKRKKQDAYALAGKKSDVLVLSSIKPKLDNFTALLVYFIHPVVSLGMFFNGFLCFAGTKNKLLFGKRYAAYLYTIRHMKKVDILDGVLSFAIGIALICISLAISKRNNRGIFYLYLWYGTLFIWELLVCIMKASLLHAKMFTWHYIKIHAYIFIIPLCFLICYLYFRKRGKLC